MSACWIAQKRQSLHAQSPLAHTDMYLTTIFYRKSLQLTPLLTETMCNEGNTVANNTKKNHEKMKTEQHKLLYNDGRSIGRNSMKSLSQLFPHEISFPLLRKYDFQILKHYQRLETNAEANTRTVLKVNTVINLVLKVLAYKISGIFNVNDSRAELLAVGFPFAGLCISQYEIFYIMFCGLFFFFLKKDDITFFSA
ncbi:uncharacterized protein LOC122156641 isoform X2 [Centrocercus urophasianus]|uniref:uncharacterized protein LOC122156641 isoform X2 n=1 Tax=Centrocercus urophasianus TaxID=9002 RepID=UPI001C64C9CE|nr:uncharacterized protein LOC122156641 isoform X2 [Centrocercus urophasianus]